MWQFLTGIVLALVSLSLSLPLSLSLSDVVRRWSEGNPLVLLYVILFVFVFKHFFRKLFFVHPFIIIFIISCNIIFVMIVFIYLFIFLNYISLIFFFIVFLWLFFLYFFSFVFQIFVIVPQFILLGQAQYLFVLITFLASSGMRVIKVLTCLSSSVSDAELPRLTSQTDSDQIMGSPSMLRLNPT